MIHDIAITEDYVIFNDLPMQFKPANITKGKGAVQFNKEMSARYGIMRRDCKNSAEIKWFDLPNHYVFHFANAWQEGGNVVMYGCSLKDVSLDHKNQTGDLEHPFLWEDANSDTRGKLTKYVFNMATGDCSMDVIMEEASDFPLIDMDLMGYPNRYVYLTYFPKEIPKEKNGVYS
jgi:carotenoid cleavage dioxygenase